MTDLRRVGDLAEQIRGVTYSKDEVSSTPLPGTVAVLRAGNIQDDGLTMADLVYVPRARVTDEQLLRKNDILVATSSGSLDIVGKAAQVATDMGMAFGAFCKVIRPRPSIHPKFLAHYFQTALYRWTVSRLAAGANINNLRNEHLDNLVIAVPSAADQARVAAILDLAESVRLKRRQALATTRDLLQSVFFETFGDPVSNPKGWAVEPLGSVAERIDYGVTASASPLPIGPKFLRITDIQDNRVDWDAVPYCECDSATAARTQLAAGDIVFARTGATTGKSFLIRDHPPNTVFASYLIRVRPGRRLVPAYMAEYFQSAGYWTQVLSMAEGAAQPGVNASKLSALRIPVPTIELQREFERLSERIQLLRGRYDGGLAEATRLGQALMQGAFEVA